MKQMKRKGKRNVFFLFLFFAVSILFSSCDTFLVVMENRPEDGYWVYNFVNGTRYPIEVTLDRKYRYRTGSHTGEKGNIVYDYGAYLSSPISLNSSSSQTVYVSAYSYTGSADFSWTASSGGNNRYIYTVIAGSTVTFKER